MGSIISKFSSNWSFTDPSPPPWEVNNENEEKNRQLIKRLKAIQQGLDRNDEKIANLKKMMNEQKALLDQSDPEPTPIQSNSTYSCQVNEMAQSEIRRAA